MRNRLRTRIIAIRLAALIFSAIPFHSASAENLAVSSGTAAQVLVVADGHSSIVREIASHKYAVLQVTQQILPMLVQLVGVFE